MFKVRLFGRIQNAHTGHLASRRKSQEFGKQLFPEQAVAGAFLIVFRHTYACGCMTNVMTLLETSLLFGVDENFPTLALIARSTSQSSLFQGVTANPYAEEWFRRMLVSAEG